MSHRKPVCLYSLFRNILLLIILIVSTVIIVDAIPLFLAT